MLEKILQEINMVTKRVVADGPRFVMLDDVERIIRSHMEDGGWIPVKAKGNPKEDSTYLCTLIGELCGIDEPFTGMCGYEDGEWDEPDCVLAWQPLPEPYRPKEEN